MEFDVNRRRFLAGAGATGALLAFNGTTAEAGRPTTQPPRAVDLRETGELQRRWLSIGRSRIVVNPLNFNATLTPLQYNAGPELPLHLGYYCSDTAFDLRSVLTSYRRTAPGSGQVITAFSDDFDSLSPDWAGDDWVQRTIVDGALQLTVQPGGTAWGAIYHWIDVDVDKTPYAEITVTGATGNWALKVNDGTLATDIVLQGDTNQLGTFTYDLRSMTGWTGTKRIQLRLFAIGLNEPITVDRIRVLGAEPVLSAATSFDNSWLPHRLDVTGTYAGKVALNASDFCYDENTVCRILNTRTADRWVLAGKQAGTPEWDPRTQTLLVSTDDYHYAIAADTPIHKVVYFASQVELTAWLNPRDEPVPNGFWAAEVDLDRSTVVGVALGTAAEGAAVTRARARSPLAGRHAQSTLRRRETEWDRLLARVPHPHDFSLAAVPAKDVTTAQVRHSYYAAWVFAVANSLPAMPESGFDYPQIPAGKPSMWVFGADGAKASAAWESFLGQQFMAYVDPELAWDAFEGLMSLVGNDGSLNGESLPSRKAQTAMVLYQITGDTGRLRRVYPALKRLLQWESEHLYWIPPGSTGDPNSRDSDFVVELLVDMAYARDLAEVLRIPADVKQWETQRNDLYPQYLQWFWPTPATQPSEYYDITTGERQAGAPIWVSTGLHLDLLSTGAYLSSLEQRFLAGYDPNGTFCSFVYAKYPDLSYTVYGLLERGMRDEAEVLTNAAIRDVTRANMFSENYFEGDFPTPSGVRPSLFGDCTIIDMVWLKNGYRMDAGWPAFVRLAESRGGIDGITIRGRSLNVALDPDHDRIRISGSLIGGRRDLKAPVGTTVPLK